MAKEQGPGGTAATPPEEDLEDDEVEPAGADPLVKITDEEADQVVPGSVPDEADSTVPDGEQ
jgi:hypothetical protein